MQPEPAANPARLLAPLALVVCTVAFFAVILATGSGDDGGDEGSTAQRTETTKRDRGGRRSRAARRAYTVKTGDSLGKIAEKTGVPLETLQELNPQLDPQALVSGQKIKLRE